MMFRILTSLTLLLISASTAQAQQQQAAPVRQEPGLQKELEGVYETWRNAMASKNLKAWENIMASYRRIETRNRIVSRKHPFPEALFSDPMAHPGLQNLFLLTILSRRDTATAVYFGKPDFGAADPRQIKDTILVLRFVKESGRWLFDNTRIVRIANNPEVLHQISQRDFSFLKAEEFQPLDGIPPIPPLVGTPELMGEIWATSIGFETELWINNYPMGKIKNGGGKEMVMGGVRRGRNQIRFRCKRLPGVKETPKIEFAIYAAGGPGEKANRVFHFGPRESLEQEEITVGFSGRVIEIE